MKFKKLILLIIEVGILLDYVDVSEKFQDMRNRILTEELGPIPNKMSLGDYGEIFEIFAGFNLVLRVCYELVLLSQIKLIKRYKNVGIYLSVRLFQSSKG